MHSLWYDRPNGKEENLRLHAIGRERAGSKNARMDAGVKGGAKNGKEDVVVVGFGFSNVGKQLCCIKGLHQWRHERDGNRVHSICHGGALYGCCFP